MKIILEVLAWAGFILFVSWAFFMLFAMASLATKAAWKTIIEVFTGRRPW